MNKKTLIMLVAAALAWLGAADFGLGLLRDEKSFYLVAAVCLVFASILLFLTNLPTFRTGE